MDKKDEIVKFMGGSIPKWKDCPECGEKLVCEFLPATYYGYKPRCEKCQDKKNEAEEERIKELEKQGIPTGRRKGPALVGQYKEVVAFGYDKKTGREVGITEKGERVDPSQTRYDLRSDPRGWKVQGKKVRETDSQGLRTNR